MNGDRVSENEKATSSSGRENLAERVSIPIESEEMNKERCEGERVEGRKDCLQSLRGC